MKRIFFSLIIVLVFSSLGNAQQVIDKSMVFPPGGGFRNYHIYLPSSYNPSVSSKMMMGFHPFNTNRWDGESWRDSLIAVAEYLDLILICPDGGPDGRIDDDYDYCRALLDSMQNWYDIDPEGRYCIGFSVGGKAVYEYALTYKKDFKGMIPIGAAMDGTSSVDEDLFRANCQNYYLIHGEQDNPNQRFRPIKDSLINNGANLDQTLMAGVGHTFDFPNRNSIIIRAFRYVDTASCDFTSVEEIEQNAEFKVFPNQVNRGALVVLQSNFDMNNTQIDLFDMSGKRCEIDASKASSREMSFSTSSLQKGIYFISVRYQDQMLTEKILVR